MSKKYIVLLILSIVFLGGCSLSPKIDDSNFTLPENMSSENNNISIKWWEEYNDQTLNALVEEGLQNNKDLQIAMLNIEYARVSLSINQADWYPTINGQAGANRVKTSKEAFNSGGVSRIYNDFSLSAILSYEVDLWGRIASTNKAARATLLSSKATADAIKLSLAANIVDSYFALISLKEQLEIANQAIKTREETVNLTKIKVEVGEERESVLAQQQSLLFSAKITKDSIEQNLALTSSALGILVGKEPASLLVDKNIQTSKLPNDVVVPENIPSSIIDQRPDIEASFQKLISSNELIGVSRAAYFPTLSISGLFGLNSDTTGDLLQSSAKTWNIGGTFVAPLIDFGKTRNNVKLAEISKNVAVVEYEKTVLTAFGEVYDALNSRNILKRNLHNALEYERYIQRTLDLATEQYNAGYIDYLTVLDNERSLLNAKISTIQTKQSLLSSGVSLFKALGGGWDKETYDDNNNNKKTSSQEDL